MILRVRRRGQLRRSVGGVSGEQGRTSIATSMVRTRKLLRDVWSSRPGMWTLGQNQAKRRLGPQPPASCTHKPGTKGPPVLTTFKKFGSNLFHPKLTFPKRPPRSALPCSGFASENIHGVCGVWVTPFSCPRLRLKVSS